MKVKIPKTGYSATKLEETQVGSRIEPVLDAQKTVTPTGKDFSKTLILGKI